MILTALVALDSRLTVQSVSSLTSHSSRSVSADPAGRQRPVRGRPLVSQLPLRVGRSCWPTAPSAWPSTHLTAPARCRQILLADSAQCVAVHSSHSPRSLSADPAGRQRPVRGRPLVSQLPLRIGRSCWPTAPSAWPSTRLTAPAPCRQILLADSAQCVAVHSSHSCRSVSADSAGRQRPVRGRPLVSQLPLPCRQILLADSAQCVAVHSSHSPRSLSADPAGRQRPVRGRPLVSQPPLRVGRSCWPTAPSAWPSTHLTAPAPCRQILLADSAQCVAVHSSHSCRSVSADPAGRQRPVRGSPLVSQLPLGVGRSCWPTAPSAWPSTRLTAAAPCRQILLADSAQCVAVHSSHSCRSVSADPAGRQRPVRGRAGVPAHV